MGTMAQGGKHAVSKVTLGLRLPSHVTKSLLGQEHHPPSRSPSSWFGTVLGNGSVSNPMSSQSTTHNPPKRIWFKGFWRGNVKK